MTTALVTMTVPLGDTSVVISARSTEVLIEHARCVREFHGLTQHG